MCSSLLQQSCLLPGEKRLAEGNCLFLSADYIVHPGFFLCQFLDMTYYGIYRLSIHWAAINMSCANFAFPWPFFFIKLYQIMVLGMVVLELVYFFMIFSFCRSRVTCVRDFFPWAIVSCKQVAHFVWTEIAQTSTDYWIDGLRVCRIHDYFQFCCSRVVGLWIILTDYL